MSRAHFDPAAYRPSWLRNASIWQWGVVGLGLVLLSLAWPLPDTADRSTSVVSLRLTDARGALLREVRPDGRGHPVPLSAVDPAAIDALLATEDQRFWWHPGIDPIALVRAAWTDLRAGRIVSGGSTITMQVARRLRNADRRGWLDKFAEMHLALRLELRWSKPRILEAWLNRVSFGNRAHGIEAAARLYFGKGARDLTRAEAAYLVGLPQSPSRYNPFRFPERARERQRKVLRAMQAHGPLTPKERRHLAALPIELRTPDRAFRAPHFTQWLLSDPPRVPGTASPPTDPHASGPALAELRTTIDPVLQRTVTGLVEARVNRLSSESVSNAAAVVLDNATGAVRAYVGSVGFWNERIQGQNDGVQMRRQPGSTLKPFTYARALASRRYTPASILADIELQGPDVGGAFSPTNYDDTYHGPVPLREALASSYNVPAVRLTREMGASTLLQTLHDAGFSSLQKPADHYGAGLTLGNGAVQLLELARAYAGLARGGSLPSLRRIRWARTAQGDTLRPALPRPEPMSLPPAAISLVTDILSDPEARAPAFGRGGPLEFSFPVAAKTGTSKDYRDNWTVGYTPEHTVAVWVGNFDGAPMRQISGVTGAGPLFHSIMQHLGPGGQFALPDGVKRVRVCPASGKRPGALCPTSRREPMLIGTAPTDTCSVHRRVPVDTRTNTRADSTTPARYVEHRRYTVYPERFHPWMRAHDRPLPPPRRSTSPPVQADAPPDSTRRRSDRLQVQYPADGTRYLTDPVLRTSHQRIHLRGTAPSSWQNVHWRVDGRRLPGDYRSATWRLRPGTHTLALWARTSSGTRRVRSRRTTITVLDASEAPPPAKTASHSSP